MDATRARRTRDQARQAWYARYRQWRFARYLGFGVGPEVLKSRLPYVADENPGAPSRQGEAKVVHGHGSGRCHRTRSARAAAMRSKTGSQRPSSV